MIILIFWILFTVVAYLLKVTNNRNKQSLTILKWVPLGFAASIFIGLTIAFSIDKFYPANFCLMNSEDDLCSSAETNCFTKANNSKSFFTTDFGFGKLFIVNSNDEKVKSELGKGYKIFGNHIILDEASLKLIYLYLK